MEHKNTLLRRPTQLPNLKVASDDSGNSSPIKRGSTTAAISSPDQKLNMASPFQYKDSFICRFCGGKSCKHENYLSYKNSAIKGLNSDWITDNILASQRPSVRIMEEFDIVKTLKDNGILAILNLQEPGEHPHCGDGILKESGFSYRPEDFMQNGIFYYNFGWKDMTATNFNFMFKILDIVDFCLKDGKKILVHCHAGRGRTLLVIAAYLIFAQSRTADEVMKYVAQKREKILTKQSQKDFLIDFEKHIKGLWKVFYDLPTLSIEIALKNQQFILNSEVKSKVKTTPYILNELLLRVSNFIDASLVKPQEAFYAVFNVDKKEVFSQEWDKEHTRQVATMKELINNFKYNDLSEFKDVRIYMQVLLDFFESLVAPAISMETVLLIETDIKEKTVDGVYGVNNYFPYLRKVEFSILWEFAVFLRGLIIKCPAVDAEKEMFTLRVAISLLRKRKALDKHFFSRNLIDKKIEDKHVILVSQLLIDFTNYEPDTLTLDYRSTKSPIMRRDSGTNSPISSPLMAHKSIDGTLKSSFFKKAVVDDDDEKE